MDHISLTLSKTTNRFANSHFLYLPFFPLCLVIHSEVVSLQPVFVYLPPYAELRGGAWAVLDPTINSDMMEMYVDPRSRAGVLEPSGTVEVLRSFFLFSSSPPSP